MSDNTNSVISPLKDRRCNAKVEPVTPAQIGQWMPQIPQWSIATGILARQFSFDDYHKTMAFVNAVAWIAHSEDHHPDLIVSFNRCTVNYSTHSVGGLSENDFICAAKVDRLLGDAKV